MRYPSNTTIEPLPSLREMHLPAMRRPPFIRWGQAFRLYIYFFFSLFWQESVFRFIVYQGFWEIAVLFSSLFSLVTAGLFALLSSFGSEKFNRIVAALLSLAVSLLYGTQYIYFCFFKVPLPLYSVGQASQISEFTGDIIRSIFVNLPQLILLFIPAILLLIFGKRFGLHRKSRPKERLALGSATLLSYLTVLIILLALGTGNTAHNIYFNVNDNDTAQRTFGVVTNMRLELQRLLFGFEEHAPENFDDFEIVASSNPLPESSSEAPSTEPAGQSEPPEQPAFEPNITVIDFDKLIADTENRVVQDMHTYFKDVEPTLKNQYTGMFKGDNLIFLTGESFSSLAVHEKYTPTLYKLANEGFQFKQFYNPVWGVSTSDGEYVACTGLLPKNNTWSFHMSGGNSMPFCLGNQFGKLTGYAEPRAYHNHTYTYYKRQISHPNMGYFYQGVGNGLKVKKVWPESDLEMMEASVPEYIHENQFHTYYMTVSGHMFYSFDGNAMAARNKDAVSDAPYSEEAKAYLAANIELDKAMAYLLEELEKAGKLDDTVIVLSGDHYPYGLSREAIDELAGHELEEDFELYQSTLIIWKNGMQPVVVDKPASSLDILPTISNLFGLEYDSRLMAGRDLLSTCDGLVIFKDRSWLTDKATYNAKSKEVIGRTSEPVTDEYVQRINREVANRFKYSTLILEQDYYGKVYGN